MAIKVYEKRKIPYIIEDLGPMKMKTLGKNILACFQKTKNAFTKRLIMISQQ